MCYILLGTRRENLFDKYLRILSWRNYLKKEIGLTFNYVVANSEGEYYVKNEDYLKIISAIGSKCDPFVYIKRMQEIDKEFLLLADKGDFIRLIEIMEEYLVYFFIVRTSADWRYKSLDKQQRKMIEKWRNNLYLFDNNWTAFKKMARKLKFSLSDFILITPDEIISILNGKKVDLSKLKKRDGEWTLKLENKKINLLLGKLLKYDKGESKDYEISGQVAYKNKNKVIGIVGEDVLVAKITSPDMTDKMIKKVAIITDEGGVLSHAAIIAREFKIPCIIGTKVATKFLKKGDKVELDMDKGIVKKI